jgi:hypothetical protein
MMPTGFERAVHIDGGNPVFSKNLVDVTFGQSDGIVVENTTNAILQDNVVIGPSNLDGDYGISDGDGDESTNLTISGNTVSNFDRGISGFNLIEIKELSNNNILDTHCPFNVPANIPRPKRLKASNNFWGDPTGPDLGNCSSGVADALMDGYLKFSPASKANPVKFNDKFN